MGLYCEPSLEDNSKLARDGFKIAAFIHQTHALSLAAIASKLAPTETFSQPAPTQPPVRSGFCRVRDDDGSVENFNHANDRIGLVGDGQGADFVVEHVGFGFGQLRVVFDSVRVAGHEVLHGGVDDTLVLQ